MTCCTCCRRKPHALQNSLRSLDSGVEPDAVVRGWWPDQTVIFIFFVPFSLSFFFSLNVTLGPLRIVPPKTQLARAVKDHPLQRHILHLPYAPRSTMRKAVLALLSPAQARPSRGARGGA